MKKMIMVLMLSSLCAQSFAVYNANLKGVLVEVNVYTDGDYIYLKLANQPSSHPTCNPNYFVISDSVPLERRQMLLSRALSAFASKENVNIGYDSLGDCVNGYMRVHRIG